MTCRVSDNGKSMALMVKVPQGTLTFRAKPIGPGKTDDTLKAVGLDIRMEHLAALRLRQGETNHDRMDRLKGLFRECQDGKQVIATLDQLCGR